MTPVPSAFQLTSWLKPFILLGVVLLLVFHPHAQAAAGLCLLVALAGWFLEGSLLAGNGATWTSMGRALTGAGTLPFYALLLLGSSTLGFSNRADPPRPAAVSAALASSTSSAGETGYRPVAAKAKAPEGGCSSGSGCGSAGGCGTGGCGASSGGACGCGNGAAKKTVAAASATAPQPIVSKQRPTPMPGLMVPIQTNRGTSPPPGASPSASQPSMAMAAPRPQVIRPGPLQSQGPVPGSGPVRPQPTPAGAVILPPPAPTQAAAVPSANTSPVVQPVPQPPAVSPASPQVPPSPLANVTPAGNSPATSPPSGLPPAPTAPPPAVSTSGPSPGATSK